MKLLRDYSEVKREATLASCDVAGSNDLFSSALYHQREDGTFEVIKVFSSFDQMMQDEEAVSVIEGAIGYHKTESIKLNATILPII